MQSFYTLCLQAMIIIAWNESGQLGAVFHGDVFKKVLSIFITTAVLKLVQAVLDIIQSWKLRHSMPFYAKLRYILKALAAAAWVIILPVTYAHSWKNPAWICPIHRELVWNSPGSPSLFIMSILIYLSPNMLSAVLFSFFVFL